LYLAPVLIIKVFSGKKEMIRSTIVPGSCTDYQSILRKKGNDKKHNYLTSILIIKVFSGRKEMMLTQSPLKQR